MFPYWNKRILKPKDLVGFALIFILIGWIGSKFTDKPMNPAILDIALIFILYGVLEASSFFSKRKNKTLNEKENT